MSSHDEPGSTPSPTPPPTSTPSQSLDWYNKIQFAAIREKLAREIRRKCIPPPIEFGELKSNSFLPRGEALRILEGQRDDVVMLFVLANNRIEQDHGNLFFRLVVASDVEVDEDREDQALCNILAFLIHSGIEADWEEWQGFETLIERRITSQFSNFDVPAETMLRDSAVRDGNLPLKYEDIVFHFGKARADSLHRNQFHFCPVILRKDQLLTLGPHHILPLLKPEEFIKEGSHGSVYKVKIAQRHFRDKEGNANRRPRDFARKDFKKRSAKDNQELEAEWALIQRFVHNLTTSTTVMMTSASLQRDKTFSVFFDLAHCDLSSYMEDDSKRLPDWKWKRHILRQTFLLAEGLKYLHTELKDDSEEHYRISCFHTDLKPSNILVVDAEKLTGRPLYDISFKITDFSVSRISYQKRRNVRGTNVQEMDVKEEDVGRHFEDRSARDVSVTNRVGAANHCLAPEALAKGARVKASADVWAFGCVLSIVVAWLYGGKEGVDEFREERAHENESTIIVSADWFFTPGPYERGQEIPKDDFVATVEEIGGKERLLTVNPAVQRWFIKIVADSQSMEQTMYTLIWELLRTTVLFAEPERRGRIEKVCGDLDNILSKTVHSPSPTPDTHPPPAPRLPPDPPPSPHTRSLPDAHPTPTPQSPSTVQSSSTAQSPYAAQSPSTPQPPSTAQSPSTAQLLSTAQSLSTTQPLSTAQASSVTQSVKAAYLLTKPKLLALQPYQGSEAGYKSSIVEVELNNRNGASRCIASADGKHFVFFDIRNISLTSLDDSLLNSSLRSQNNAVRSLYPPNQQRWAAVGLSNKFLCAATHNPSQTTFVIYDLTTQDEEPEEPLNKAVCNHGNCTAIAVCHARNTKAVIIVYAAETQDKGSKSRAVFCFEHSIASREVTSRPNPTRLELKNNLSGEIKDLKISADGQYVSIVEQTTLKTPPARIMIRVHTWNLWLSKKQRTPETFAGRSTPGFAGTVFTSVAYLTDQPAFVLIIQESVVKTFNFRTAETTTLVGTTGSDSPRYLRCMSEKAGKCLLLEMPPSNKVVSVHNSISFDDETPASDFVIMVARERSKFKPNDCAVICYTPKYKQGILVLARCNGTTGRFEIMRCPTR